MLGFVTAALLGASCYLPPIDAPVVDPFREPACTYCAGNRGIEYSPHDGQAVVAAAAGTVTFSGVVAATRYVVVEHAGGLRMTYGKLASADVTIGERVLQGGRIGTSGTELFIGLRRGEVYIDPAPFLGRLRHRTRLVPTDGTRPRPVGPPRLVCAGPISRASDRER